MNKEKLLEIIGTIYNDISFISDTELEQIRNEKNSLSVNGEKLAEQMSNYQELKDIDILYSSHYVRAMCTAKYIAEKNNIILNVDERLGERKFGVNSMSEPPKISLRKNLEIGIID